MAQARVAGQPRRGLSAARFLTPFVRDSRLGSPAFELLTLLTRLINLTLDCNAVVVLFDNQEQRHNDHVSEATATFFLVRERLAATTAMTAMTIKVGMLFGGAARLNRYKTNAAQ